MKDIMSEDKKTFRHVALEQRKLLLDFMAQHPDLATGTLRTLELRHQSKQYWKELTKILNNHRGAKKTQDGWSKYWSDFKNKLKNRMLERNRRKLSKKDVRPLTKLEKQAYAILGPAFEKKHLGCIVQETSACDPLPREIKQESITETTLLDNGSYQLIDNDVMLGLESDGSAQSSDEECVEEDQSAYEPLLNNIYPKWLMDIERQRAEADLRRAKAEELRAQVSVKTADASLIQAEALKTLSEAAEKQAEAIMRIATVMESRSEVNMDCLGTSEETIGN